MSEVTYNEYSTVLKNHETRRKAVVVRPRERVIATNTRPPTVPAPLGYYWWLENERYHLVAGRPDRAFFLSERQASTTAVFKVVTLRP